MMESEKMQVALGPPPRIRQGGVSHAAAARRIRQRPNVQPSASLPEAMGSPASPAASASARSSVSAVPQYTNSLRTATANLTAPG